MHLGALAIFGACTAGAREVMAYDPETLCYAHYECLGRPFSLNTSVWREHLPPLARLATVEYAREHGGALARVVQLRLLFNVIMRDCVAVAQNPRKRPDETLVEMFRALQRSGFEEACHSTRKR